MKNNIILLIAVVLFANCTGKTQAGSDVDDVQYDSVVVLQQNKLFPEKPNSVPYVKIFVSYKYPKEINDKQKLKCLQELFNYAVLNDSTSATPQAAVDKYIHDFTKNYREENVPEYNEELKGIPADEIYNAKYSHIADISNIIEFTNNTISSFSVNNYIYSGGTNGDYSTHHTNINLSTCSVIKENDIFISDYQLQLSEIIKAKLRNLMQDNLKEYDTKGIDPEVYLHELQNITSNNNFLITDKGLRYTYNAYEIEDLLPNYHHVCGLRYVYNNHEIAAYESSMLTIDIGYPELQSLLKPEVLTTLLPEIAIHETTTQIEKPQNNKYVDCPFAYLTQNGRLYFYNTQTNTPVKFTEESDGTILNFVFNPNNGNMYYTAERDGSLWLKVADFSTSPAQTEWVADWKLSKSDCYSETLGEITPLLFHKGQLLIQHDFEWEMYSFTKSVVYNTTNQQFKRINEFDYDLIQKFSNKSNTEHGENKRDFSTKNNQLYFKNVCVTNEIDFESIKTEGYGVETEFINYSVSPDGRKVLFGAIIEFGDLAHGPYCIANADGSNQQILEDTDIGDDKKPHWMQNGNVVYIAGQRELFHTNAADNSVKKIAEDVVFIDVR